MKDLTKGKEGRVIFRFALPMILGNVFQQLYNIIDSAVVGHFIGKEALSAVGASFPLIFVLVSLIIGFAMGSTILISQFFGAKQIEKVKQTIDTLNIVMFFSSIVVTIVGIAFSGKIFALIDLPPDILPLAKLYFNILMLGNVSMFGFNAVSSILRGLGDSKTPLYFLIISTLINIVLDLLFVIVFKWGIAGVAIASVMSYTIAFIVAVIYLNRKHEIVRISFIKLKFSTDIFKKGLKIGLPSGFQHMFVAMGMLVLFGIVAQFGTDVMAAYSVSLRLSSFAFLPAMNFSIALTAFVGQNIGAKKLHRVKKGLISTILMTSGFSVFFSIIFLLFSKYLMTIFTTDPAVIEVGQQYFRIVSYFYITFSLMFSVNAVFRGAGDTIVPMFITLLSLWVVRVPLAYALSMDIKILSLFDWQITPVSETGIWWAIPLAWIFGLILSTIYYFTGRWKKKVVVK